MMMMKTEMSARRTVGCHGQYEQCYRNVADGKTFYLLTRTITQAKQLHAALQIVFSHCFGSDKRVSVIVSSCQICESNENLITQTQLEEYLCQYLAPVSSIHTHTFPCFLFTHRKTLTLSSKVI